jgi:superfamily I DNA/RNA helicase/mRNA-degrading endonuclease RelE of RelBE toxin-antitoxin system
MQFLLSDTFTTSLSRLTGEEQKLVKTTVFDLQVNPANPGHSFHKLDRAKDPHFWSVRVGRDIRLIVHRTASSLLLCYVDHHDAAYRWAERRKLETHPKTGAAQIVQLRETVREIIVSRPVVADVLPESAPAAPLVIAVPAIPPAAKPLLFADVPDDQLLSYGVPTDWLEIVRALDADGLLEVCGELPAEAAEALLELATGNTPQPAPATTDDPFAHPDAQRRFRTLHNVDELAQALDAPWETWAIFLHPMQQDLVVRDFSGPARVSGSAGTGKTVVALHRAVALAKRFPDSQILLTTFSPTLAAMLRTRIRRLLGTDPRLGDRIEVADLGTIARRLYENAFGRVTLATPADLEAYIRQASAAVSGHAFGLKFLLSEWTDVVDAWQIRTWEAYRDVRRLGRKIRLPEAQRAILWSIFAHVMAALEAAGRVTEAGLFTRLAEQVRTRRNAPFDCVIVDEAQDLSVAQLRLLAAIGQDRSNALFFAGDLGQRIFQAPFSWLSLGVDIRGRARTLTVNYRTSHQIRTQADRLLAPALADVDGHLEERSGTVSVFNGPQPQIHTAASEAEESAHVGAWLRGLVAEGISAGEIAVFVRSEAQFERAKAALSTAGLPFRLLDEASVVPEGRVTLSTMHHAKGLEFKAVAVMACDDEILPLQARMEEIGDDADLETFYNTERHLLYVALTRARDRLLVTSVAPRSEFIDDLEQR